MFAACNTRQASGLPRSDTSEAPPQTDEAPSPLAPTGFPSPLRGGVRGGGNPDIGCSAIPPTLSLPHVVPKARLRRDGGGDATANVLRVETKTASCFASRNLTHSLQIFALKLS
jgi:hypothetical protein